MQKDLLTEFESKKIQSLCIIISLLVLLRLSVNFFWYYTPLTKEHLLYAFSGIERMLFILSFHILPLVGSILLLFRQKLGWSFIVIYSIASIATDLHSALHQKTFTPLCYAFFTAMVIVLLITNRMRKELKINTQILICTLLISPIIPTVLIILYG